MPALARSWVRKFRPNKSHPLNKPAPWPLRQWRVFLFLLNLLHTFLAAGFVQATDYLGEDVTIGSVTATAFVTPSDEKLAMELTGYMDELDYILTLNVADWVSDIPQVKDTFTLHGDTVSIRSMRTDQSAYLVGVKKISV